MDPKRLGSSLPFFLPGLPSRRLQIRRVRIGASTEGLREEKQRTGQQQTREIRGVLLAAQREREGSLTESAEAKETETARAQAETDLGLDPRSYVTRGMERFQKGDIEGSLSDFNLALRLRPPIKPYLWQRGLSLYYAREFQKGAEQFRSDVEVNPSDSEEAVWTFLCEAQVYGFDYARDHMLSVNRDSRDYMRKTLEMFRGTATPAELEQLRRKDDIHDFYGALYLALFYEAKGDPAKSLRYMQQAAGSPYGRRSGDYMWFLSQVHLQRRQLETEESRSL
uniref:Uncharacterized protein n=1 Tax=Chromera velia CCMP2878 TaxID=1169474 RepID=A0A0G4HC00_9ALVE|eukprot:Cvel_26065.t1-p1 / transcript=Cvel_26065.t1 / gene=Cvel_26065 / organism=Chromera_velia_CCMP2878 / gene_product=hypothetical protein / transcript_product=hypothetical protein / location=Cvel_scaffold3041:9522-12824(+) / protein_length=280 / sequence_SO=supercontig / SO=protein_coding / is_pseudo=false